jgi:hypothetical protein
MAFSTRLKYEPLRSVSATTFTGDFIPIGSPLQNAASIVKIINDSIVNVEISIDGITAHDFIPVGGFVLYDCTMNAPSATNGIFVPANTQFFVKGVMASGDIYVSSLYVDVT